VVPYTSGKIWSACLIFLFFFGYHTLQRGNSLKSVERFDHMMFVCRFQASLWSKPQREKVKIEKSQTPKGKISIVLWRGLPSQRTIEILPLGVWDFSVLTCHQCLIIFLTQTSPSNLFFFLCRDGCDAVLFEYTHYTVHVNKHKSNVGHGNVGENKIIWIYLVKLFY
jgi:hypothetical protein